MAGEVRLQKFLSQAGVASRRAAEELIRDGRVRVNGKVAELGSKVDPEHDRVHVDGERVRPAEPVWIALYKPVGYVTTRSDPEGRPTVYDLVPDSFGGLFHVGRLDYMSEGLVLLTNQGDLANRLLHPRYEVDRVYEVELDSGIEPEEIEQLLAGVELEDGVARAKEVERLQGRPGRARLRVTLQEGRNREVRRLFAALGRQVVRLTRQRYGPVTLGRLEPGRWRRLSGEEIERIRRRRQGGHGRKGGAHKGKRGDGRGAGRRGPRGRG